MYARLSLWRKSAGPSANSQRRFKHAVVTLQLDHYMSAQYAGIANAIVHRIYEQNGIELLYLPHCPPGMEQERVRAHQNAPPSDQGIPPSDAVIGCVEQNVLIPTLAAKPELKTTAVAAMFEKSPLNVASLGRLGDFQNEKIDANADTASLMKRMFPGYEVVIQSPGKSDGEETPGREFGVEAYITTEVNSPRDLHRLLGKEPAGTKFGYSQVLFATDESLEGDRREIVAAFLEATFRGWRMSIHDPDDAARSVKEAKRLLQRDIGETQAYEQTTEYELEVIKICNDAVYQTEKSNRFGIIDVKRWDEASKWLLGGRKIKKGFGLDSNIWREVTL